MTRPGGPEHAVSGGDAVIDLGIPATEAECEALLRRRLSEFSARRDALASWLVVNRDSSLIPVAWDRKIPLIEALIERPEQRDGMRDTDGPANRALRRMAPTRLEAEELRHTGWHDALEASHCGAILCHALVTGADRRAIVCTAMAPGTTASEPRLADFGRDAARIAETFRRLESQRLRLRLEQALEQTALGCFLTDAQGRILWMNEAGVRMSGHLEAQVLGATPRMFHSGRQSQAYYREFWNTIGSGRFWSREIVERRRDGDLYTVRQTVSPIRDDTGIVGFFATHEDVSLEAERRRRAESRWGLDPITDLSNLSAWCNELERRRAAGAASCIAFLALGDLSTLAHLHDARRIDAVLEQVAEQLRERFDEALCIAHAGDGRFALLFDGEADKAGLRRRAQQLASELREPLTGVGEGLRPRLRFAILMDDPDQEPEALFTTADDAAVELP